MNNKPLTGAPFPALAWGEIELKSALFNGPIRCDSFFLSSLSNTNGLGGGEINGFSSFLCEGPPEGVDECIIAETGKKCDGSPGRGYLTGEMPLRLTGQEAEVCKEVKNLSECEAPSERERRTMFSRGARRTGLPWTLQLVRGERKEEELPLWRIGAGQSCYPTEKAIVEGKEVEVAASWEKVPAGCVKINVQFPELPGEFVFYGTQEFAMVNGVKNGLSPSHLELLEAGHLQLGGGFPGTSTSGGASLTGRLTVAADKSGPELLIAR